MKTWSRKQLWLAGLAVILSTNLLVLGGAAWNRSGSPESVLTLSERELVLPYWTRTRENSGIRLRLNWRVQTEATKKFPEFSRGNTPGWLDETKMKALGFQPETSPASHDRGRQPQESREVLLVLEMDGPVYRQALDMARTEAEEADAFLAATPNGEGLQNEAQKAHERLQKEERESSRLFVIDAGLDKSALRARYPDSGQYAIIPGRIGLSRYGRDDQGRLAGHVSDLSADTITLPTGHHPALQINKGKPAFTARLAFGQRLEPWIVDATTASNPSTP